MRLAARLRPVVLLQIGRQPPMHGRRHRHAVGTVALGSPMSACCAAAEAAEFSAGTGAVAAVPELSVGVSIRGSK